MFDKKHGLLSASKVMIWLILVLSCLIFWFMVGVLIWSLSDTATARLERLPSVSRVYPLPGSPQTLGVCGMQAYRLMEHR